MTKIANNRIKGLARWWPRVTPISSTLRTENWPNPAPWMRRAVVTGGRFGHRHWWGLNIAVRLSLLQGVLFGRGYLGPLMYSVGVTAGGTCSNVSFKTRSRVKAMRFTRAAIEAGASWVLCDATLPWSLHVQPNGVKIESMGWIWNPACGELVTVETFWIRERQRPHWLRSSKQPVDQSDLPDSDTVGDPDTCRKSARTG